MQSLLVTATVVAAKASYANFILFNSNHMIGKRPSPFAAAMAEPTVCKFVASSHLQSYFPPLEALEDLDPEVRAAKRQKYKKSKTGEDEEEGGGDADGDEGKGDGKESEGENYSSDEEEEEEESSSESEEEDVSEDEGRKMKGRKGK